MIVVLGTHHGGLVVSMYLPIFQLGSLLSSWHRRRAHLEDQRGAPRIPPVRRVLVVTVFLAASGVSSRFAAGEA